MQSYWLRGEATSATIETTNTCVVTVTYQIYSVICLCDSTTPTLLQVLDGRGAKCWVSWRLCCSLRQRKHFQGVGRCRMQWWKQEMDLWKSTRQLGLMSLPSGNGGLGLHLFFTTPHYRLPSKILTGDELTQAKLWEKNLVERVQACSWIQADDCCSD